MISYVDIAFAVILLAVTAVGARRGFMASMLSALRFVLIVPLSLYLTDYVKPYFPDDWFSNQPEQILNVAAFLICFIVLLIVSSVLIDLAINIQKKKGIPLKNTNAVLGGLFGFVKAVFIIFVISTILGYLMNLIPEENSFAVALENSYILKNLKNVNLFEIVGGLK